jgi:hypothetical protein
LFGRKHSVTTRAAWYLLLTLRRLKERETATAITYEYIAWLLNADEFTLTVNQREIREHIKNMMGG